MSEKKPIFRTRECHRCGWAHIQLRTIYGRKPDKNDPLLLQEYCPICNKRLVEGDGTEDFEGCAIALRDKIYNEHIKGNEKREAWYAKMCKIEWSENDDEDDEEDDDDDGFIFGNMPKCPTCGTTNIRRIRTSEKLGNAIMWGLYGNKRRQQFECLNPNCRYRW